MTNGGDAAEQVVRLSLEGFEVAAKLSGAAAKNIAVLLVSVLKQEQKTKGKLYMYTALAPIPLSTFAGEPSQNVGKSFIKSYCAVLIEGAVIVLACIIFSLFASTPPVVNPDAAAVTQVWAYIGELVFNMLRKADQC